MFRLIFKLFRAAMLAVMGAAVAAKFLLESNAEASTEDIDLISIFEGHQLVSEADPFYGGKVMAIFGGAMLDLRKATPAPTGIYLDLVIMMGGLSIIVPEGWRATFDGSMVLGGFSDETHTDADDDVPTVHLSGLVLFGGVQVTTKSPVGAST